MRFTRGDGLLPWDPADVAWVLKGAIPLWKTCQQVNRSQTLSPVSTERSRAWEYPTGIVRNAEVKVALRVLQLEMCWLLWDCG